jgi:hypothetical protein
MRERQRRVAAAERKELAPMIAKRSFSDFMRTTQRTGFPAHFLILGDKWWDFSNDNGIEPLSDDELDDGQKAAASNSLGKAELVIDVMADVIETLTKDLADYWHAEIDARVSELENADLSDPKEKKRALAQIVRLHKMRDQLKKQVRWTFPQWRVVSE